MGQAESNLCEDAVLTPPHISQRRSLYLTRLGIRKPGDARAGFNYSGPCTTMEAPDRLTRSWLFDENSVENGLHDKDCDYEDYNMNDMSAIKADSRDDFRMSYLRRLSYENVWTPLTPRPPAHQTVTIFDWDDTLLPTSDLNVRTPDEVLDSTCESSTPLMREMRGIRKEGLRLLELAMEAGQTFIITNALPSWVEYSAAKYMPEFLKVLKDIPVISARGEYETQYPGERSRWKEQAFMQVQKQLDSQMITNLISLGDSNFEMDAVHVMGREFSQALVKTVKFRANPSAKELHKELELVATKFEQIVNKAANLKICLERITPASHDKRRQRKGE